MDDPVLTDHAIITLEPQPTVAVRARLPMDQLDLGALFAAQLARIHAVVAGGGPPYGRYHEFGPTHADVEIGIPVGASQPDLSGIEEGQDLPIATSQLPGGLAAFVIHHGSYDTLGVAYDRLHDWINAEGHEDGPGPWESYIDDPAEVADVGNLRTALYWPLADK